MQKTSKPRQKTKKQLLKKKGENTGVCYNRLELWQCFEGPPPPGTPTPQLDGVPHPFELKEWTSETKMPIPKGHQAHHLFEICEGSLSADFFGFGPQFAPFFKESFLRLKSDACDIQRQTQIGFSGFSSTPV